MPRILADRSPDEKCLARFGVEVASTANPGISAVDLLTAFDRRGGREPDEEWLYLEGAGASRWLKVIVVFDNAERGRIITAFARRMKP